MINGESSPYQAENTMDFYKSNEIQLSVIYQEVHI